MKKKAKAQLPDRLLCVLLSRLCARCLCQTVAPPAADKITLTKGKEGGRVGGGGGGAALLLTQFSSTGTRSLISHHFSI